MADYNTMIEQFGDWWGQDQVGMEDLMDKIDKPLVMALVDNG